MWYAKQLACAYSELVSICNDKRPWKSLIVICKESSVWFNIVSSGFVLVHMLVACGEHERISKKSIEHLGFSAYTLSKWVFFNSCIRQRVSDISLINVTVTCMVNLFIHTMKCVGAQRFHWHKISPIWHNSFYNVHNIITMCVYVCTHSQS